MTPRTQPLRDSLLAAFKLDAAGAYDANVAADCIADVLVAFSGQLASDIINGQHQLSPSVQCPSAHTPGGSVQRDDVSGTDVKRCGEHALGQRAEINHPATDDIYATDDHPLDGCTVAITLGPGATCAATFYRPGGVVIAQYSDREASELSGLVHRFVNPRISEGHLLEEAIISGVARPHRRCSEVTLAGLTASDQTEWRITREKGNYTFRSYFDSALTGSYRPVDKSEAAMWALAAILGYEPPRSLRAFDAQPG